MTQLLSSVKLKLVFFKVCNGISPLLTLLVRTFFIIVFILSTIETSLNEHFSVILKFCLIFRMLEF